MNSNLSPQFCLGSDVARVCLLLAFSLRFCLPTEAADSEGLRVIWKRELPDDVEGRYERRTTVHKYMSPSEKEIEFWKNDPSIEKVEIINGRDVRITTFRDLRKEAEDKKWKDEAIIRYVIQERFGAFNYIGASVVRHMGDWMFFDDPKVSFNILKPGYGADRGRIIEITLGFCEEQKLSHHDLLRKIIKFNPEIRDVGDNRVFVCERRMPWGRDSITAWLSGDHLWVDVGGVGVSDFSDVIRAYLKKHPSTLPKDFRIDRTAWGRDEVELWLGRMKRALDEGDKESGYRSFTAYLFRIIAETAFIPEMQGLSRQKVAEAALEKKKEVYDVLLRWWQAHKDSTYWHAKLQMLVAKGQSPDELREAAEKKQRQEITAKLNAPLKEEKELVAQLVKCFEAEMQRRVKEYTESTRGFEKVDEGVWKLQWRQYIKGAWSDVTIRGPQLKKTSSKRYPLVATFTQHAVEQGSGKKYQVMDEFFYYDKLHDRWVFGELPNE